MGFIKSWVDIRGGGIYITPPSARALGGCHHGSAPLCCFQSCLIIHNPMPGLCRNILHTHSLSRTKSAISIIEQPDLTSFLITLMLTCMQNVGPEMKDVVTGPKNRRPSTLQVGRCAREREIFRGGNVPYLIS